MNNNNTNSIKRAMNLIQPRKPINNLPVAIKSIVSALEREIARLHRDIKKSNDRMAKMEKKMGIKTPVKKTLEKASKSVKSVKEMKAYKEKTEKSKGAM